MLLYYIQGSPFARMARVLMREFEIACDERKIDEFPPSRDYFTINPLGQVPVLEDGGTRYFPTAIVLKHIMSKSAAKGRSPDLVGATRWHDRTLEDEQLLTVLLMMGDILATTQYLKWAGMTGPKTNKLGFGPALRNRERVAHTLDWLEARASHGGFQQPRICVEDVVLACLIMWTESRGPIDWRGRPKLESIVSRLEGRPSFLAPAPLPLVGFD
jgi:glutathione S-transferase